MNDASITRATFAVLVAILFHPVDAQANDKFTCWQPNIKLVATSAEYWTKERRDKALPDSDDNNFASEGTDKVGDAEKVSISDIPFKFGGKLFFTRDKQDYQASAQFVEEDNIVIAAAHSMWKGGSQATNIAFFRGYDNGGGTKFDFDQAAILTAWKAVSSDQPSVQRAALDYSALRTTAPSDAGKFLLGIDEQFTEVAMMGYPKSFDNGKYMYKQISTNSTRTGNGYEARPNTFTGGASGGAWFVPSGDDFAAVSTVSGGGSTRILGPAFTEETKDLISYVIGGCK